MYKGHSPQGRSTIFLDKADLIAEALSTISTLYEQAMSRSDREGTPMPGSTAEELRKARVQLSQLKDHEAGTTIASLTFRAFSPYEHDCSTSCKLHGDNDLRAGLKRFKATKAAASSSGSKSEEDNTRKKYDSLLSKARLVGYQLKTSVKSALSQDTDPGTQRAQEIIDSLIEHSVSWDTMDGDKSDQDSSLLEELQEIATERQCPDLGLDLDEEGNMVDVNPTSVDEYWSQVMDKSANLKSQLAELHELFQMTSTDASAPTEK